MTILSPFVVTVPEKRLCPHCGKASYSRDGIHPQCSLAKADLVVKEKLLAKRKVAVKVEKPKPHRFSKKCPTCDATIHVRINECTCGHQFVHSAK